MVHRKTRASARSPRRTALGVGLATLVLLSSSSAFGRDPSLDVSQYAHTTWRIRDGFTRGKIHSIAQTTDGYLWLATDSGLLRFDGVRTVPWPPAAEGLPASHVTVLAVGRDGTLWIGTAKGLASLRGGKLTNHPEVTGRLVRKLRADRDGTLWFAAVDPAGGQLAKLCAVESEKIRCEEPAEFGPSIFAIYPDQRGNLWVSATTGLWRWKPGPPDHYRFPAPIIEVNDLIEDDDGALLLATNDGLKRLADGRIQSHSFPGLDAMPRPIRFRRSARWQPVDRHLRRAGARSARQDGRLRRRGWSVPPVRHERVRRSRRQCLGEHDGRARPVPCLSIPDDCSQAGSLRQYVGSAGHRRWKRLDRRDGRPVSMARRARHLPRQAATLAVGRGDTHRHRARARGYLRLPGGG